MSPTMNLARNPVRHTINAFPATVSPADVARIRAMVIEYRPIPEIASIMNTTVQQMDYYLRDRRQRWLDARHEGKVEFLPNKTVIYRRRSNAEGGFVLLPFSVPANSMHRAALEARL